MTPILHDFSSRKIFDFNEPLSFVFVPCRPRDDMAELDVLVQIVLHGNILKVLQNLWRRRITDKNQHCNLFRKES